MIDLQKQKILQPFSEDNLIRVYKVNPEANFGSNLSENIIKEIMTISKLESSQPTEQGLVNGIVSSYIAKYFTNTELKAGDSLNNFELHVNNDGKGFMVAFNREMANINGQDVRMQGTSIFASQQDQNIVLQAYDVAYLDSLIDVGFDNFLESGLRGEIKNTTIIAPQENGEVKVGSSSVIRNEKSVSVNAIGFVVDENWNGNTIFTESEECQLFDDSQSSQNAVDAVEVNELMQKYNELIKQFTSSQTSSEGEDFIPEPNA